MARYIYQGTWQDGNGQIVEDGNVTVYLAGTITLATIYSAVSGGTAVTGSVVQADEYGYFKFYVDTATYSFSQLFKIILSKTNYNSKTYDYKTNF